GPLVLRGEGIVVVVPGRAAVGVGVFDGGVGGGRVVYADGGDAVLVEPVDRRVLGAVDVPVLRVAGAGVGVRRRVQDLAAHAFRRGERDLGDRAGLGGDGGDAGAGQGENVVGGVDPVGPHLIGEGDG